MPEYIVSIGNPFGEVEIRERLIRCRDCWYFNPDTMSCLYYSDDRWLCLTPPNGYCRLGRESPDE